MVIDISIPCMLAKRMQARAVVKSILLHIAEVADGTLGRQIELPHLTGARYPGIWPYPATEVNKQLVELVIEPQGM